MTDDELQDLAAQAIADGVAFTTFIYSLRSQSFSFSDQRARRMWDSLGGPIRPKTSLYAPGTGPTENQITTNRGPNHWRKP